MCNCIIDFFFLHFRKKESLHCGMATNKLTQVFNINNKNNNMEEVLRHFAICQRRLYRTLKT